VPYGSYETLGDLRIDFHQTAAFSNYRRELDLETAIATVTYIQNGIRFKREAFISYPDRVLVMRITADKANAISFSATLDRPEKFNTTAEKDNLLMQGTVSNGKGGSGMHYATRLRIVNSGGTVKYQRDSVTVENATTALIILNAGTNYRLNIPDYSGIDPVPYTLKLLDKTARISYEQLRSRHLEDYRALAMKSSLQFTHAGNDDLPTDQLLQQPNNLHLQELYYQYGRYLLIASSRKGSLPANLQGIWSNKIQTPWNGDYHANINIQMNYWPADVCNLSECFSPFAELVASLRNPGAKTAAVQYQLPGWCVETITNVWGYTSPGEGTSWGMYVAGGGWLAQQLWDHYLFTGDQSYLEKIFPILIEASRFYLAWLVKDPESGKWVSGPSTSPENSFRTADGQTASVTMGPFHDQQVIAGLFRATVAAAKALNKQSAVADQIQQRLPDLEEYRIGQDGRLMEWQEPFEEVEPDHRHVSHLFLLYPGNKVDPVLSPELAAAAKKSLAARGDAGTGWSLAWKINFWARLLDGNHAYLLLQNLLKPARSLNIDMAHAGGTYDNLFCAHPPFQIDGNFGATAGMAEMLLQSHGSELQLLPALPDAWAEGEVTGLLARGGYEISMKWADHQLLSASLFSLNGGECVIRSSHPLQIDNLNSKSEADGKDYITRFTASRGQHYTILALSNEE